MNKTKNIILKNKGKKKNYKLKDKLFFTFFFRVVLYLTIYYLF